MNPRNIDKAGMRTEDGYWLLVVAMLLVFICLLFVSGCQTTAGAFRDIKAFGEYGTQHTRVEP